MKNLNTVICSILNIRFSDFVSKVLLNALLVVGFFFFVAVPIIGTTVVAVGYVADIIVEATEEEAIAAEMR